MQKYSNRILSMETEIFGGLQTTTLRLNVSIEVGNIKTLMCIHYSNINQTIPQFSAHTS